MGIPESELNKLSAKNLWRFKDFGAPNSYFPYQKSAKMASFWELTRLFWKLPFWQLLSAALS